MEKLREWKDFKRSDKVVIILGVLFWLGAETGVYIQSIGGLSKFKQMVKSELVKQR